MAHAFGFVAATILTASAQLVNDSATNSINGTNVNLGATNLVVGTNGPNTTLILTNGGSLTNAAATIGLNNSSTNNQVIVTGTNSVWVNTGDLTVGSFGARNTLRVTNGAAVQAPRIYVGSEASSVGNLLTVGDGTLTATNALGTGVLDVRRGSVDIIGGDITTDQLLLTNSAGNFVFNSGTLATRSAVISNGQSFVVGASAGSGAATWNVGSNATATTVANDLILGSGVAYALAFNGANQYVAVSNFGAIAPTNEVTVEFWAFANFNSEQSAAMLEPDEITNRFNAHISFADTNTYWDFGNVSNANARISFANPPNTISNWVHYALVASQGSNFMRIYRNGVLVANRPGMTPFARGTQELRIGGTTGYFFRGRIDEFRIWKTALPQTQIQSNLSRVLSGTETNLLLYYRFDSTNGTVATNSAVATGPTYNGALINNPAWIPSGALQTLAPSTDQAALVITNGGRLEVAGNSLLGNNGSTSNNFALVAGANSAWSNSGGLFVGASGSFNSLFISNGGWVANGAAVLGFAAGANNNQAIVSGPNSKWTTSNNLDVGTSASGNILLITNGGRVTNRAGTLGLTASATSNQVIVTGPNSQWASSTLNVGSNGSGNALAINGGGQAASGVSYLGFSAGASNNQLAVGGASSLLTNSTDVFVGLNGSGNTLWVTNGGQALNRSGYVGYGAVARGNLAVVSDVNSAWINTSDVHVGSAGAKNFLLITNGGRVVGNVGIIGNAIGSSNNQVTVTGAGSLWSNNSSLFIGNFGASNQLFIGNGGQVANDLGFIGNDYEASNNLVVVTGTNSVWTNRGDLAVGFQSFGNALLISNAARVVNNAAFIGSFAGANSNQVIATGTNSLWLNNGDLFVGNFGAGNSLRITNGATVRAANTYVGSEAGSIGNSLSIGNGTLTVTNIAGTSVFEVRRGKIDFNDGAIVADRLVLTNAAGTFAFNSGTLSTRAATINNGQNFVVGAGAAGNPAVWIVRSNTVPTTVANGLIIGANAPSARLLLTNGGMLLVSGASTLGNSGGATNGLAVVAGDGSFWSSSGFLYVGFDGSGNTLLITNRGRVQSDFGIIGESVGGGNNNQVIVTGPSSSWTNLNSLYIGNSGSGNALHITNGGAVRAANAYVGASLASTGNLLDVGNGILTVTNVTGTGDLEVRTGSAVVNGGTITADRLLLTNAGGVFNFNSGTLNARGATVANGTPFIIGNGQASATYRLSGAISDIHNFANSLVISSNATLTGNGTISGLVTNFGNLAPGNSAGSLRIEGDLSLAASARMTFEIGGLIATNQYDQVTVTNFVQFAGTLSLALINGFTPAPGDAFTLMKFASRSGTFANATLGAVVVTADQKRQFTVTYSATNLVAGNFEASLLLTTITPTPSQVTVQFQSITGRSYEVQYSGTLTNWTPVIGATFTTPLPGITQWIDTGALTGGLPGTRFYRVRQLP